MAEETSNLDRTDLQRRFFDQAEVVSVTIHILKETYDDILAAIERNGWELEEGLRILLTLGLGYTQGQRFLQSSDEEQNRLVQRLMDLESVAAVMKFRTFCLMRDNQVLDMRMGALQNTISGLQGMVDRLRAENAALTRRAEELASKDLQDADHARANGSPWGN